MKSLVLGVLATAMAATAQAGAQTAPKAATPKPAGTAAVAKTGTAARTASAASRAGALPAGVPVVHGIVKTAFALRYQDYKLGTGPEGAANQLYKVEYTVWLAADGKKIDSSFDHPPTPVMGADGKPEMGADNKPKTERQPLSFPQGYGRLIPGFDQGVLGMHVGGKRRIFVPWQLAYGAKGRPSADPAHPGVPAKADLIFDVELVGVSDVQMPAGHPMMMPPRPGAGMPANHPPVTPGTPAPATAPAAPATPATSPAAPAAAPATTPAPAAPKTPQM